MKKFLAGLHHQKIGILGQISTPDGILRLCRPQNTANVLFLGNFSDCGMTRNRRTFLTSRPVDIDS